MLFWFPALISRWGQQDMMAADSQYQPASSLTQAGEPGGNCWGTACRNNHGDSTKRKQKSFVKSAYCKDS